jgi:hypothetical protein
LYANAVKEGLLQESKKRAKKTKAIQSSTTHPISDVDAADLPNDTDAVKEDLFEQLNERPKKRAKRIQPSTVQSVSDVDTTEFPNGANATKGLLEQSMKKPNEKAKMTRSSTTRSVSPVDTTEPPVAIPDEAHLSNNFSTPPLDPPASQYPESLRSSMSTATTSKESNDESAAHTQIANLQRRIAESEAQNATLTRRLEVMQGKILSLQYLRPKSMIHFPGDVAQCALMRRDFGVQASALHMHIRHIGDALTPLRERISAAQSTTQSAQSICTAHDSWVMADHTIQEISHRYPPLPAQTPVPRIVPDDVAGSMQFGDRDEREGRSGGSRKRAHGL